MNLLAFEYTNWRGHDHKYVIVPESVEWRDCWVLHGHVVTRDGDLRPDQTNTRRTFELTKMRNLHEVPAYGQPVRATVKNTEPVRTIAGTVDLSPQMYGYLKDIRDEAAKRDRGEVEYPAPPEPPGETTDELFEKLLADWTVAERELNVSPSDDAETERTAQDLRQRFLAAQRWEAYDDA